MSDDNEIVINAPAPRANPLLIGQEAAEKVLLDAFASGRLPHAWLLHGPRGIGKATLAFRFARFLLQGREQGGLFGPPDSLAVGADAPIFKRVTSGGHPDLRVVERAVNEKTGKLRTHIIAEDTRELSNFLHLTPSEGGWRVAIVDAADEMNPHAANALLKILEEPPPRAVLILVSHAPGGLLATIRSRCRKLALQPLADADALSLMGGYCPELGAEERQALIGLADGSPGRALELAASGSLELYAALIDLIASLPRLDQGKLHALADRMGRAGADEEFRTLAFLLDWWLQSLVRAAIAGEERLVVAQERGLRQRLSGGGLDRWVEVWEKVRRLFAHADAVNLDRKQVVLGSFLALEATARG